VESGTNFGTKFSGASDQFEKASDTSPPPRLGRSALRKGLSARVKPIVVGGYKNLMTNRSRVAITLATALVLGAEAYGHAFDISLPGALHGIWDHSNLVIYGLAILGVFLVYRWWALLPAIAPVAVIVYLHNMTDYVSPWREEPRGPSSFSDQPVLYVLFVLAGIALSAAFLSVGLLLRAAWKWVRSGRRAGSLPDSA
jgi:hypothetical protein